MYVFYLPDSYQDKYQILQKFVRFPPTYLITRFRFPKSSQPTTKFQEYNLLLSPAVSEQIARNI